MALIGTVTDQVLVDSTVELFVPAVKIDEIRASIRDATCTVIANKVIYQGVLHKQIFFVREPDNVVVHQAEDIPFSGFVDLMGAAPNHICEVAFEIAFVEFELLEPTLLRQKVVIDVTVSVFNGNGIPVPVNGAIPVPVNGGTNGGNGIPLPVTISSASGNATLAKQVQPKPVYVRGAVNSGRGRPVRSAELQTNPQRAKSERIVFKAVQKVPVREYIARR